MKHVNLTFPRLLAFLAVAAIFLGGCTTTQMAAPGPSPTTLEKLRTSGMAPANLGRFALAPGKDPEIDKTLGGLRGSTAVPAKGSFAQMLRDTLQAELAAAGLYDEKSTAVIEGLLTDSRVDAAIGTGTASLGARFKVLQSGQTVFEKELTVSSEWESSFVGGVAIPKARTEYQALYKALVARLIDDSDFRRVVARK